MRRFFTRIIAPFCTLALLAAIAPAADAPASRPAPLLPLPRLKLAVGQELVYESTGTGESQGDTASTEAQWRLWVTAENPRGGWDLLIQFKHTYWEANARQSSVTQRDVLTGTIHPDGRLELPAEFARRGGPAFFDLFAQFPADETQAAKGYVYAIDDGASARVAVLERNAKSWQLRATGESDEDTVFELQRTRDITFDPDAGLVTAIDTAVTQGYGIKSKMTTKIRLKKNENHDAEWLRDAAKDAELISMAMTKHWEEMFAASHGPSDEIEKHVTAAAAAVDVAAGMAATDTVREFLDEQAIPNPANIVRSLKKYALLREKVLNQPAPDWTLEKVAGGKTALADLRGKVVVLDFWYRGCGYCIQAMPQVRRLSEDFKNRDVVILGMNTDRELADAKLVIDKMKIPYDNLRVPADLPDKYAVRGYPTMIVIDKKGIIRETHVGYSPTLKKDVSATLEKLLKE